MLAGPAGSAGPAGEAGLAKLTIPWSGEMSNFLFSVTGRWDMPYVSRFTVL